MKRFGMSTPLVIAISGASGSGKSLFTENLLKEFSEEGKTVQILREDHYYRSQDHLPMADREKTITIILQPSSTNC